MTVNGLHDKMNSGTGRGQERGQLGVGQQAGQGGALETSSAPHGDRRWGHSHRLDALRVSLTHSVEAELPSLRVEPNLMSKEGDQVE